MISSVYMLYMRIKTPLCAPRPPGQRNPFECVGRSAIGLLYRLGGPIDPNGPCGTVQKRRKAMPTWTQVRTIVASFDSSTDAAAYCDRIASVGGPLSRWYELAAGMIRTFAGAR